MLTSENPRYIIQDAQELAVVEAIRKFRRTEITKAHAMCSMYEVLTAVEEERNHALHLQFNRVA
jgi:hypothetical protein